MGIPQIGKQYEITSLMKSLVEVEDHFFQLIAGHFPTPKSLHSTVHPIRLKRVMLTFWNDFFRGSALKEIVHHPHLADWKLLRFIWDSNPEQRKLGRFRGEYFSWNTLNFVSLNMADYVVDEAELFMKVFTLNQRKMIKIEWRFTSEYPVITDDTLAIIGRDLKWLFETDRLSQMTFRELQQNRGLLLIMNMALEFGNVGGRCGVDQPPSSANYRQAIFWYVMIRHAIFLRRLSIHLCDLCSSIWPAGQKSMIIGPYTKSTWAIPVTRRMPRNLSFSCQQDEDLRIPSDFDDQDMLRVGKWMLDVSAQ